MLATTDPIVAHQSPDLDKTPVRSAVVRFYERVDQGDFPGVSAMFTPEATYHRPGYPPIVGTAQITAFYLEGRMIREGVHTLTTVIADGPHVAVNGEFNGTLRDGSPISLRFSDFFIVDQDHRFTRRDTFFFAPLV